MCVALSINILIDSEERVGSKREREMCFFVFPLNAFFFVAFLGRDYLSPLHVVFVVVAAGWDGSHSGGHAVCPIGLFDSRLDIGRGCGEGERLHFIMQIKTTSMSEVIKHKFIAACSMWHILLLFFFIA